MAISSIISFGFGNGTFSPGVSKLPTLGYSVGVSLPAGSCVETTVFIALQAYTSSYILPLQASSMFIASEFVNGNTKL